MGQRGPTRRALRDRDRRLDASTTQGSTGALLRAGRQPHSLVGQPRLRSGSGRLRARQGRSARLASEALRQDRLARRVAGA